MVHIGHLHRGIEKLAENLTYDQFIPVVDRLDYVCAFANSLGYVQAVEKLMDIEVPPRAHYLRVILTELNRIASHCIWLGGFAIDLGAITPIMYAFREREEVFDIFEQIAGARMTHNYFRIGGVKEDIPEGAIASIKKFVEHFPKRVDEYETLLSTNRILLLRTKGVGIISREEAINYGVTGPTLRASGVAYDVRKAEPYAAYGELEFDVPTAEVGDAYNRYRVRMEEMRQSCRLVAQATDRLPAGEIMSHDPRLWRPPKEEVFSNVENLIQYCYLAMHGITPPKGEVYVKVEGSKGELGYYIISDGSAKPYRVHIRTPSFSNVAIIPKLAKGRLLPDLVPIIGAIDIVLGEIDK